MKVNAQRILDYISGNDIPEEELERLEDNEEFMIAVLKHTKDKATAFYASDRLMKSPTYIRRVVELFENDFEFIISLVEKFEQKSDFVSDGNMLSDEQIAMDELSVVLSEFYNKTKDDRLIEYKMLAANLIKKFQLWVLLVLHNDEEIKEELFDENTNLRFQYILSAYQDSQILTDFFMKNIVDDILYDEDFTLEELIHFSFSGVKNPKDINSLEMLLTVISEKDQDLSDFLIDNPQYLQKYIRRVERIKESWKSYLDQINVDRVDYIMEKYHEYELGISYHHSKSYLLSVAVEKLGLQEFFMQYSQDDNPYQSSEAKLKEKIIVDHQIYNPDKRLSKAELEHLVKKEQEMELEEYEQEFVDYISGVITQTLENDLPVDKMRMKKTQEAKKEPSTSKSVTADESTTVEVDFVNKKILRIIKEKKEKNSN